MKTLYFDIGYSTVVYSVFMKVLTTAEAAERLTVTVGRVHQLISEGRLPAQKLGRDYVIRERDLKLVGERKPGRPPRKKSTSKVGLHRGRKARAD